RKHAAYPPPPSSYPPPDVAPLPAGHPTRDGGVSSAPVPIETKSRGDGFWKGCCAARCCCWVPRTGGYAETSAFAYPPEQAPAYVAPPPAGYPTRDGGVSSAPVPIETKSRGDGFWKGCCAALCCCWVLDVCF
ncbi:hypothetical protein MUK42_04337, partial [Musa troglodytarum]